MTEDDIHIEVTDENDTMYQFTVSDGSLHVEDPVVVEESNMILPSLSQVVRWIRRVNIKKLEITRIEPPP